MDRPIAEIKALMLDQMAKGRTCFAMWTCPGCGERCMSGVPNALPMSPHTGCEHEKKTDGSVCGTTYIGKEFGLRVVGKQDMVTEAVQEHGLGIMQFLKESNN